MAKPLPNPPPNGKRSPQRKTAYKTARPSPRSGVSLPVGAHPWNTGGKKGRSGRKPNNFVEWCDSVTKDETVRAVNLARAKAGDIKVLTLAANYAHGKPTERVEVTGKDGGPITQVWRFGDREIVF